MGCSYTQREIKKQNKYEPLAADKKNLGREIQSQEYRVNNSNLPRRGFTELNSDNVREPPSDIHSVANHPGNSSFEHPPNRQLPVVQEFAKKELRSNQNVQKDFISQFIKGQTKSPLPDFDPMSNTVTFQRVEASKLREQIRAQKSIKNEVRAQGEDKKLILI